VWARWQWFTAFDHQPWTIRAVSVVAVSAPMGFVLGLTLPFVFRTLSSEEIPGQWALHVTSWVFGACTATFLSVHWGFDIPLIIAACVCGALFALHALALGLRRLG